MKEMRIFLFVTWITFTLEPFLALSSQKQGDAGSFHLSCALGGNAACISYCRIWQQTNSGRCKRGGWALWKECVCENKIDYGYLINSLQIDLLRKLFPYKNRCKLLAYWLTNLFTRKDDLGYFRVDSGTIYDLLIALKSRVKWNLDSYRKLFSSLFMGFSDIPPDAIEAAALKMAKNGDNFDKEKMLKDLDEILNNNLSEKIFSYDPTNVEKLLDQFLPFFEKESLINENYSNSATLPTRNLSQIGLIGFWNGIQHSEILWNLIKTIFCRIWPHQFNSSDNVLNIPLHREYVIILLDILTSEPNYSPLNNHLDIIIEKIKTNMKVDQNLPLSENNLSNLIKILSNGRVLSNDLSGKGDIIRQELDSTVNTNLLTSRSANDYQLEPTTTQNNSVQITLTPRNRKFISAKKENNDVNLNVIRKIRKNNDGSISPDIDTTINPVNITLTVNPNTIKKRQFIPATDTNYRISVNSDSKIIRRQSTPTTNETINQNEDEEIEPDTEERSVSRRGLDELEVPHQSSNIVKSNAQPNRKIIYKTTSNIVKSNAQPDRKIIYKTPSGRTEKIVQKTEPVLEKDINPDLQQNLDERNVVLKIKPVQKSNKKMIDTTPHLTDKIDLTSHPDKTHLSFNIRNPNGKKRDFDALEGDEQFEGPPDTTANLNEKRMMIKPNLQGTTNININPRNTVRKEDNPPVDSGTHVAFDNKDEIGLDSSQSHFYTQFFTKETKYPFVAHTDNITPDKNKRNTALEMQLLKQMEESGHDVALQSMLHDIFSKKPEENGNNFGHPKSTSVESNILVQSKITRSPSQISSIPTAHSQIPTTPNVTPQISTKPIFNQLASMKPDLSQVNFTMNTPKSPNSLSFMPPILEKTEENATSNLNPRHSETNSPSKENLQKQQKDGNDEEPQSSSASSKGVSSESPKSIASPAQKTYSSKTSSTLISTPNQKSPSPRMVPMIMKDGRTAYFISEDDEENDEDEYEDYEEVDDDDDDDVNTRVAEK